MNVRNMVVLTAMLTLGGVSMAVGQGSRHDMHDGRQGHGDGRGITLDGLTEMLELSDVQRRAVEADFFAIREAMQDLIQIHEHSGNDASHPHLAQAKEGSEAAKKAIEDAHERMELHLDDEQREHFAEMLHEHLMQLPGGDAEGHEHVRHRIRRHG